jgi:hypothetical protein
MNAWLFAAALMLLAGGAHAAQFDRAVSVTKVPPKSADDPAGQITCTFYRDLMVRESGTDTPDPNDAVLVRGKAPRCDTTHRADDIELKTEGFSLLDRKGPFLFFGATDPNGAIPFKVIDLSGRVIFEDGTPADRGIQSVVVENGALHMRYRRGFNASCSLMQNAANCWSKLVAEGKLPQDMAQPVSSSTLCAASYKADKAPADDPSIVMYDVEIRIDPAGQAHVLSHGAVSCAPVP